MKLAGVLLLPAGWAIAISAVVLFAHPGLRWIFVLAGLGIEAGGLALVLLGNRYRKEMAK